MPASTDQVASRVRSRLWLHSATHPRQVGSDFHANHAPNETDPRRLFGEIGNPQSTAQKSNEDSSGAEVAARLEPSDRGLLVCILPPASTSGVREFGLPHEKSARLTIANDDSCQDMSVNGVRREVSFVDPERRASQPICHRAPQPWRSELPAGATFMVTAMAFAQ